jgi:hypothetical protein
MAIFFPHDFDARQSRKMSEAENRDVPTDSQCVESSSASAIEPVYVIQSLRRFIEEISEAGVRQGQSDQDSEESGCIIWDVSALPDQALFLLDNGLLEILAALLPQAAALEKWRWVEVALGTLANIACHEAGAASISTSEKLAAWVINQAVSLNDQACVSEACRLAATLLKMGPSTVWLGEMLDEEEVTVKHLCFILENTLNAVLLERA